VSDPEPRRGRLEPAAGAHRRNPQREAGGIIGLDRNATECRHAGRRFEAAWGNARVETRSNARSKIDRDGKFNVETRRT